MIEMKERSAIKLDWSETLAVAEEQLSKLIPPGYELEIRKMDNNGLCAVIGLSRGYFDENDLDSIYEGVGADPTDVTSTERGVSSVEHLSESLTRKVLIPAIPLKVEEIFTSETGICFFGDKKK